MGDSELTEPDASLGIGAITQIAVMADGSVFVNREAIPIQVIGAKLDEICPRIVLYFREHSNAPNPHPNSMAVIDEIRKRGLPIAMFIDPDFTQQASMCR